jgi:nucleoside-diphosphate-sugar epimerase
MDWTKENVVVTGGASFIGSHLVRGLIQRGVSPKNVTVIDNLSSGKLSNLGDLLSWQDDYPAIHFMQADLRDHDTLVMAGFKDAYVFHLAADHGGRGYVDLHQGPCANNLMLDGMVFNACRMYGAKKVIFASSGCIYPNYIQENTQEELYLTEDKAGPPYDADHMYGWAKLMAEMTLKAYHKDYGMKSASLRYFTVYGPLGKEDHAVIAMIGRAFLKKDPFEIWGDGTQIRNWTYIDDIVEGTILAAENIDDATAINLGTMERVTVLEAAQYIMELMGHKAELKLRPDMPTGPKNRVADNSLAEQLLGWEPKTPFKEGVKKTILWYKSDSDPVQLDKDFDRSLTER